VEIALNQLDSARAHLEAAERLIDPDAPDEGVEAGSILDLLGHVAFLQARYDEAAGYFERAISRYEVSPAGADSSERVRGLASALNNLGGLYFVRRELEASEHTLHRALALYRSIHGESPHTDLIAIHNSLGNVYRLSDSLGGAIAQFEAALAMSRLLLGRHPTTATLASNLGVAFLDAGCAGNVRGLFEEALDIRRALLDPAHPSLGVGYYNLGVAVQKCEGRPAEAIPWLDRALASLTVGTQPNDLRLATNHYQLGEAHRMAGTPAMGLSHTREALRIRSLQLREPNRDIGRSLTSLGLLFTAVGRRDSAAHYLDRAVAQFEAMPEPDAEGQRIALEASIDVLIAEGRCADARVRIDRRLALTDSVLPDRAALLRKRESCSTP
jgi:tetratricopeptide (TPR) repeat protein